MKKAICTLLAICLCLLCCAALFACSKETSDENGECSFSDAWSSDATHHWHACTDEDCAEVSDKAEHDWKQTSLNEGVATYTCEVCDKTKNEQKGPLYKAACEKITEKVHALATGSAAPNGLVAPLGSPAVAPLAVDSSLYVNASSMDLIQIKGVTAFVDMLADMLDNPDFNITSSPVQFTYSYAAHGEQGTAVLMYEFDEENNKVIMYWDVASSAGGRTTDIFLYLNVDYDFAAATVGDFTVHTLQQSGGQEMLLSYLYLDGVLKSADRSADLSSLEAEIESLSAVLAAKADAVIDLEADFSAEYTAMMDKMNGRG